MSRNLLTVAMATYQDFPGVYMTLEVLREFHPHDVDVVVLDNAPISCNQTRDETLAAGGRYFHRPDLNGTSRSRDRLFHLANTPWVLVVDSHIVLCKGSIEAALDYAHNHPVSRDIIQGPLINSGVTKGSLTHWRYACDGCLWGEWDGWPEGNNFHGPAFEIPMQGLGIYMMRKEAWPGYNPHFFGFGGEEGYIHEKVRRLGGRALCLPALRWRHRFRDQKDGQPYPRPRGDHVWNLVVGHRELGIDRLADIRAHHGKDLNDEDWAKLTKAAEDRQLFGEMAPMPPKMRLLGVWYSNNAAPESLLSNSLKTIKAAVDSSYHNVEVSTCSWNTITGNPFPAAILRPSVSGHAAILEQINKAIDSARSDFDALVFLEHDVLYPPDYFDRVASAFTDNPNAPVVSNLNYIGLNATGWLAVKERHEPMHQLSMRKNYALANLARASADCHKQGWAYLEPEGDRANWAKIQPVGRMPSVHVNHEKRFTSHGEVCYESDSGGKVKHAFWGEAKNWWPGTMELSKTKTETKKKGCGGCNEAPAPDNHPLMKTERESLEKWYNTSRMIKSDCDEHLPAIKELASKCSRVTELSAWNKPILVALAYGCSGQVTSCAKGHKESWPDLSRLCGERFEGVIGDSCKVTIEPTDLLFIDTLHRAAVVYQELTRHHEKVSKYIVIHCTNTFGERGDDGGAGVLPGLRKFLREHPEWNVRDYYNNNHGLIVLTKAEEDRKELPGLARQAGNYFKAKLKQLFKGPGIIPLEMAQERLDICSLCPARQEDRCSACGCYLQVVDPDGKNPTIPSSERGEPGRTFHGHLGCPLGKWDPIPTDKLKELSE